LLTVGVDTRDVKFMRWQGGADVDANATTSFRIRAVFAVEYKSWNTSDVGGLQPRFRYEADVNLMQG
jgi:hypothetical protein